MVIPLIADFLVRFTSQASINTLAAKWWKHTIEREYAPLELIADNYEKVVVSLDDLRLPSRNGIKHVMAWELSQIL